MKHTHAHKQIDKYLKTHIFVLFDDESELLADEF